MNREINSLDSLGAIIDMSFDNFKSSITMDATLTLGDILNLITVLELSYNDLKQRKDAIISNVASGVRSKDDPVIVEVLNNLYAEMLKIEEKVTYLKEKKAELIQKGVI